jgi:hypothetical protein
MIQRVLVLLLIAGIYVAIKRVLQTAVRAASDNPAEAQWANEGGANASQSV